MPLNAINICEQLRISNKLKSSDNALLVDKDPAWLPEKFEDQLNYEILYKLSTQSLEPNIGTN